MVFAAPADESAFGDIQFGGDPREGPILGAEKDETFDDFVVFRVHDESL